MPGSSSLGNHVTSKSHEINAALLTLLDAFYYAQDTQSHHWDFAVGIGQLRQLGLNESDLRWLVRKGWVKHGSEVTHVGDNGREFRSTGDLTFAKRSCFVLTDKGIVQARAVVDVSNASHCQAVQTNGPIEVEVAQRPPVHWDAESRKLLVHGKLAKRFKWPAENQETVLNAFEEDGWPNRIDDPLPPQPEQDSKRRLSDTIKCLNRKQTNSLIHFFGDGTGEGVGWELVETDSRENSACRDPA